MSPRDWALRPTDPCFHQNRWMPQSGWGYYFHMRGALHPLNLSRGYISISLYYFRNQKRHLGNQTSWFWKSNICLRYHTIGKRLTIKNAFQRANSTNLENISVLLVIKIEKFWKSNSSVIWEIKRHKFWKSRVSFEKSSATKFGNQKCQLRNQNPSNFGNQKCHLRNQTR